MKLKSFGNDEKRGETYSDGEFGNWVGEFVFGGAANVVWEGGGGWKWKSERGGEARS